MLYVVWFTDNPERAAERERHMPAHLAFLERNADRIRAAGPLRDAADNQPAGGLWLVEAADHADVVALYQADPFWPTGLRKSVEVFAWRQVFADGRRMPAPS
jgi:uncharacterized protein YciI